jgi:predicted DNA binding CopG/RHH family protein
MSDRAKPIDDLSDIPENLSDEEQIEFLETHGVSEEFLAKTKAVPENERPRPRSRSINLRIDDFTLGRLKGLAERRNVGYQTLLKEFVIERLYEEEKREGILSTGSEAKEASTPTEAAHRFTDALVQSYKMVAERDVSAQKQSSRLTEVFFNSVIDDLRAQAEENQKAAERLADQQRRLAGANQTLTRESVGAYMDFLNSAFSFWQEGVQEGERGGMDNEKPDKSRKS